MNNKHRIMTTTRHLIAGLLLGAATLVQAASPIVVDNTDGGFSVVGTWPTSTAIGGYQGSNYQSHEPNGSPPGAVVVDNSDAGFSVTGTWPASTAIAGYLGTNYQTHAGATSIVVDNTAGTAVGTWGTSTSVAGYYGSNYQAQAAGAGSNTFTWTPTIPATGSHKIYARWTHDPNRSAHAAYTVNHAGGATVVNVNQQTNGGDWRLLGTYTLSSGTGNTVVLTDQSDGVVVADAIKFVPEATATWTPTIVSSDTYKVYARWTADVNRAGDARYTVTHGGGDTLVIVNQQIHNGMWTLLGTFPMAPSSGHKVVLTDEASGTVSADAIQLVQATAPPFNTATWAPAASEGQYEVYAKWTAYTNRATNAPYTIHHTQGSTQVPVNQQSNGGAFNLLGIFNLNSSSTITLTDNANGIVVADAIQLVALTTTPKMYFVHTDHLNTPRLIADDVGQTVWTWNNDDPYGNNAPNENPSGAGNFTCNLRLPGQYFDTETNAHYNYFRDCYDPATGRYCQSDPIGLAGGINTYTYVGGNPISISDPLGLVNPIVQNLLSKLAELATRYTAPITALAADIAGINGTLSSYPLVTPAARALVAADLGIRGNVSQLCGTIAMQGRTLNLTVDMIEANIKNKFQVIPNLIENATMQGATEIRIQATIANEALLKVLTERYRFELLKGEGKYQDILVKKILVNQIPK